MPGGDRTGPVGVGPMTGRGAGFCAGYGAPGYIQAGFGRSVAYGSQGGGRRRNQLFARARFCWQRFGESPFLRQTAPFGGSSGTAEWPQVDLDALKAQAREMEQILKDIRARLDALAAAAPAE